MLGKLFGKKDAPKHFIVANLNARIMPLTRGGIFEDPLDEALKKVNLGEVTGGGTQLNKDQSGVESVDIEIEVNAIDDKVINLLTDLFVTLGAPRGSKLLLPEGRTVPIGTFAGIELLFEDADQANDYVGRLNGLEVAHEYGDYMTQGRSVNLYGPDYEAMLAVCQSALTTEQVRITRLC